MVTDFACRTSTQTRFESQRFTDFPTIAEAIKANRLDATFMVVPLAMKLREQGLPIKIVYLGHHDGSTVIVRAYSDDEDLKRIHDMALKLGLLFRPVPMSELIDRSFIPQEIQPASIDAGAINQQH